MSLFKPRLFAAKHAVPHYFDWVDAYFSGEDFVEAHASLSIFNWTMIDGLLDFFVYIFKD